MARADVARDQLMLRQSEVGLKVAENQIRVEVENALVASAARGQAMMPPSRRANCRKKPWMRNSSFGWAIDQLVIQYERDLAQARWSHVPRQLRQGAGGARSRYRSYA